MWNWQCLSWVYNILNTVESLHSIKVQTEDRGWITFCTISSEKFRIKGKKAKVTSSHSAPWNTTRPSHSRHLDGALSFLSLWVWAALDIWVFLKGPGELAVSITISLKPAEWRERKKKQRTLGISLFSICFVWTHLNPSEKQSLYHKERRIP